MNPERKRLEQVLGWTVLALLLGGCLLVLRPFLSALLWATILSFSLWPLYGRLLKFLGGRRTLAALGLALAMVGVLLFPVVIVGVTLGDHVTELTTATQRWLDDGLPAPPAGLAKVPVVGQRLVDGWARLQGEGAGWVGEAKWLVDRVGSWLLKMSLIIGSGLFQLALSILMTFLFLRNGPALASRVSAAVDRIAGERGRHLLAVAGTTVRGVVYGVLGAAFAQALMAAVGLALAGVPGPSLLALLVFLFSVVPAGPFLVMLPAALWLFHQGATSWGVFLLIWGVGVSTIDNVVRPWLISQGSELPFLLIFLGVLGGAVAFGFIGVFIGPTLLAVGHRIVQEWASARNVTSANLAGALAPRPST